MADMNGYQFSPDLASRFRTSLNNPTGGSLPQGASQALQVLSLHLPAFLGGNPIAPDALLRPRLGGTTPDSAVQAMTTGVPPTAGPAPSVGSVPQPSAPSTSGAPGAGFVPPPLTTGPNGPVTDQGAPPSYGRTPPSPTIIFHGPPPPLTSGPIGQGSPDTSALQSLLNGIFGGGPGFGAGRDNQRV